VHESDWIMSDDRWGCAKSGVSTELLNSNIWESTSRLLPANFSSSIKTAFADSGPPMVFSANLTTALTPCALRSRASSLASDASFPKRSTSRLARSRSVAT